MSTISYPTNKRNKSVGSVTTNEMDLLKELTNARGQKTFYEYDKAGRIISYTDTEGTVITYDNNECLKMEALFRKALMRS